MEHEIFERCTILYDKLISYGFQKASGNYILSKVILDGSLRVEITISDSGMVTGKIYDVELGEEYTHFRIVHATGEFVSQVKEAYKNILLDIQKNCTESKYFMTDQANRIAHAIIETYHDLPEFAWEKYPDDGIFKNPHNGKWYGLMMNIPKNKIDIGDETVEILNVKLNPDEIKTLLEQKGFYRAYHMNKQHWITILLDDTVSDQKIMSLIDESHQFTTL